MQKYLTLFKLSFVHGLRNYKALVGLSLFLLTCLLIFSHLWKVAAAHAGAVAFNPNQLLWYIAFNEWVLIAFPDIQEEMEQDLRSGKLAYLLPRPISYLLSTFCEGFALICVNLLVLGLVAFTFTFCMVGAPPVQWGAFPILLAVGLLSGCVGLIFQLMIGISAFWLQHVSPMHWVWEKLLLTLGGLMLPLTVYPAWLQKIALITPFPAILGHRSALAIQFSSTDLASVVALLLFWAALGSALLTLLYRRGLAIVAIGGG